MKYEQLSDFYAASGADEAEREARAVEVKTPPEWLLIYELAQLPCLAATGWPHDGCFSCRAKALRDERERKGSSRG